MSLSQPGRPLKLYDPGYLDPISINGVANCENSGNYTLKSLIATIDARLDTIQSHLDTIASHTNAHPYSGGITGLQPPGQPLHLHDTGLLNPISMNGLCNLVNYGHRGVALYLIALSDHIDQIAAAVQGINLATDPLAKLRSINHAFLMR